VVLPAPFGPANATTIGRWSIGDCSSPNSFALGFDRHERAYLSEVQAWIVKLDWQRNGGSQEPWPCVSLKTDALSLKNALEAVIGNAIYAHRKRQYFSL
jgi:hypothetical protein